MGWLSNIFSSGASSLVNAVGDAIDKNFTTTEEKKALENELKKAENEFKVNMKTLDIEETKAYLGDVNSARDNHSRVQESVHSSWLARNVQPILALTIIGLTFFLYYWIIMKPGEVDKLASKELVFTIVGALSTISMQVVAFFFGSSQGSKDKQITLDKIGAQK